MLRHVVLFRWAEGTPEESVAQIREGLMALGPQIPSIRSYACGPDLGLGDGTWDFAIVADFDDAEGWAAYDSHPEHERVRRELIRPHLADRSTVRFAL